jgi:hypothetical protein
MNAVLYLNVRKDDSDKEHHRIKISFDDPKVDPIAVEADKLRFYQRIDKCIEIARGSKNNLLVTPECRNYVNYMFVWFSAVDLLKRVRHIDNQ